MAIVSERSKVNDLWLKFGVGNEGLHFWIFIRRPKGCIMVWRAVRRPSVRLSVSKFLCG